MKKLLIVLICCGVLVSFGPPNCNLYKGDEPCYNACREAEKAIMHTQGSRASQIHFDKSIALCSTFAYSYYEKSVPYVKRGLNHQWRELIDKAVAYSPKEYLAHRGWCAYMFVHDYRQAVDDIEELDALLDYDIGPTGNGEYHLHVIRALAYKGLNQRDKAISILENLFATEDYLEGLFDYFHLGVLYLEVDRLAEAEQAFAKQVEINDFAEIYYYRALAAEKMNQSQLAITYMEKALDYYEGNRILINGYTVYTDKVFRQGIERELTRMKKDQVAPTSSQI